MSATRIAGWSAGIVLALQCCAKGALAATDAPPSPELVARGAYLTNAAATPRDERRAHAGRLEMLSPLGTIVSSNITPMGRKASAHIATKTSRKR